MKFLWRAMPESDVNINATGLGDVVTHTTASITVYANPITGEMCKRFSAYRRRNAIIGHIKSLWELEKVA